MLPGIQSDPSGFIIAKGRVAFNAAVEFEVIKCSSGWRWRSLGRPSFRERSTTVDFPNGRRDRQQVSERLVLFPDTSVQMDRTDEEAIAAVPQFAVPQGRMVLVE